METTIETKGGLQVTPEECDLAELVGLCLCYRVLYVIPSGEVIWPAIRGTKEGIWSDSFDHKMVAKAWKIASTVALPALNNVKSDNPLDGWSEAIWTAIVEARDE